MTKVVMQISLVYRLHLTRQVMLRTPVFQMQEISMRLALFMALTLGAASGAVADTPSPVKTAELSARLFEAGVAMSDPLIILTAAKLRKTLNPAETARKADDGATATDTPLGWQEMLAAAEPLATGDETLLGLIGDIRAESTKGVATGPVYNIGRIANSKTDTYAAVSFVGGDYAEVYVEGKGSTDLNLTITDAKGRLVCSDTDKSHIAYCGWRPSATEAFSIKVENRGPAGVNYALMTN